MSKNDLYSTTLYMVMKKIIITGGPCTGKTSVINELALRGYTTGGESAREILGSQYFSQASTSGYKSVVSNEDFINTERKILQCQITLESMVTGEGTVFLDRSILDPLAYIDFIGVSRESFLETIKNNMNYHPDVFILDQLPFYVQDDIMKETHEEAKIIHNLIRDVYREFGFTIIDVPCFSVPQRADYILSHISQHGGVENGRMLFEQRLL